MFAKALVESDVVGVVECGGVLAAGGILVHTVLVDLQQAVVVIVVVVVVVVEFMKISAWVDECH